MIQVDDKTWRCAASLSSNPDFQALLSFIKDMREDARETAEAATGENVFRALGASIALGQVLDIAHKAPDVVERLRHR